MRHGASQVPLMAPRLTRRFYQSWNVPPRHMDGHQLQRHASGFHSRARQLDTIQQHLPCFFFPSDSASVSPDHSPGLTPLQRDGKSSLPSRQKLKCRPPNLETSGGFRPTRGAPRSRFQSSLHLPLIQEQQDPCRSMHRSTSDHSSVQRQAQIVPSLSACMAFTIRKCACCGS